MIRTQDTVYAVHSPSVLNLHPNKNRQARHGPTRTHSHTDIVSTKFAVQWTTDQELHTLIIRIVTKERDLALDLNVGFC